MESLLAAIIGALIGVLGAGVFSGFTWWYSERRNMERELLSEALNVQALHEAWILEGQDLYKIKLSENKYLPIEPQNKGPWLRQVEVRAVLDEEDWTLFRRQQELPFYNFLKGRRTWIVRDHIPKHSAYDVDSRPGLISSKAIETLAGWIELVASTQSVRWPFIPKLSKNGIKMISPLLTPLAKEDKAEVLEYYLTPRAIELLEKHRRKYCNSRK